MPRYKRKGSARYGKKRARTADCKRKYETEVTPFCKVEVLTQRNFANVKKNYEIAAKILYRYDYIP